MLISQTLPNPNSGELVLPIDQIAAGQGLPGAQNLTAPDAGFGVWLGNIMSAVILIAALLVLFYLIWGGIEWITAGGDKAKVEKARNRITQAIIGIIVLGASVAILIVVQSFLGFQFLRFSGGSAAGGGGGGNGSGGGGGGGNCTPSSQQFNDGGAGRYCQRANGSYAPAMVKCNGPDGHLPYNHYDPCSCVEGSEVSGYDFGSC